MDKAARKLVKEKMTEDTKMFNEQQQQHLALECLILAENRKGQGEPYEGAKAISEVALELLNEKFNIKKN